MAQNVRGQTLIDAIVQVFRAAHGERSLTSGEVARRLRAAGFWGGKEPKTSEQMVASYLSTRHAGMFEPGSGGTFALKSTFMRTGTAAPGTAPPARSEPLELRPLASAPPGSSAGTGAISTAAPASREASRTVQQATKRKKRKSLGGASVAYVTPADLQRQPLPQRINLHLSFEEAMKLHLGLGQLLTKLSGRAPAATSRRKAPAKIRVDLARQRISLFQRLP